MSDSNITIRMADWSKDRDSLQNIRRLVFVDEQKVPVELEWDEYDDTSSHFLVSMEGKNIATARLKADGQIGRMAVLADYRNQGIGTRLLNYVLCYAQNSGYKHLYLHAQTSAIAFYRKHGFTATGDIFYEADIPHRLMSLNFDRE